MDIASAAFEFADRDGAGNFSRQITDLLLAVAAVETDSWDLSLQEAAISSAIHHERPMDSLRRPCEQAFELARNEFLKSRAIPKKTPARSRMIAFSLRRDDWSRVELNDETVEIFAASEDEDCARLLTEIAPAGFIFIRAGHFFQGGGDKPDQLPQLRRWLPGYYMARYPTTASECSAQARLSGLEVENDDRSPLVPANHVSFEQASQLASAAGWRLPSEAEWEKAATGPIPQAFPWGSTYEDNRANTRELGIDQLTTVDYFDGRGDSPYGVADLVGNAWEWTSSCYLPYISASNLGSDPRAALQTADRVLRGGAYDFDQTISNNLSRYRCAINRGWDTHGYRYAGDPSQMVRQK